MVRVSAEAAALLGAPVSVELVSGRLGDLFRAVANCTGLHIMVCDRAIGELAVSYKAVESTWDVILSDLLLSRGIAFYVVPDQRLMIVRFSWGKGSA